MNKQKETFHTSNGLLWVIAIGMIVIILLGHAEQGQTDFWQGGVALAIGTWLLFFLTQKILTRIVIREGRLYRHEALAPTRSLFVENIIAIHRVRQFVGSLLKTEGARMKIEYLDDEGAYKKVLITEKMYAVVTIKKLLCRLNQLNPSIHLDDQYADLLEGAYDDKNFHKIPAMKYGLPALDK